MKRLVPFVLLCLCLTGCVNFVEEIFINKDGSGKYQLTIDFGAIYQMQGLFGSDSTNEMGLPSEKFDSVFYFRDFPDSVKRRLGNSELADRIIFTMHGDSEKKELNLVARFDFKSMDELNELNEVFQVQNDSTPWSFDKLMNQQTKFIFKGKRLERTVVSTTAGGATDSFEEKMTLAMLSTSFYTTIYHLPSKVRKTNISDTKVKGNVVTVENRMVDLLSGSKTIAGTIDFK
jgi:hypothetical protein